MLCCCYNTVQKKRPANAGTIGKTKTKMGPKLAAAAILIISAPALKKLIVDTVRTTESMRNELNISNRYSAQISDCQREHCRLPFGSETE